MFRGEASPIRIGIKLLTAAAVASGAILSEVRPANEPPMLESLGPPARSLPVPYIQAIGSAGSFHGLGMHAGFAEAGYSRAFSGVWEIGKTDILKAEWSSSPNAVMTSIQIGGAEVYGFRWTNPNSTLPR